jgi:phosphate transport system substrate-binding protein
LVLWVVALGCGGESGEGLRGHVRIDGSSTVYPIAEALSEEFQLENPRAMVTAGLSGTGGGFERFCRGETDVATASRVIREAEARRCRDAGVEFLELPVALDGLSIIVNAENSMIDCLSTEELRRIWRPGSPVRTWRHVRPEFPGEEIKLYAPGTDSGTFDFFTETVVGEVGSSRTDFQASEDDNVLVQGVSGDRYSLGYLGYGYLVENRERLKVVAVDGGSGCILPSEETIRSGAYSPLGRPVFFYLDRQALMRPEVMALMEFFMVRADEVLLGTGLLPLPDTLYAENLRRIRRETLGEVDRGEARPGGGPG